MHLLNKRSNESCHNVPVVVTDRRWRVENEHQVHDGKRRAGSYEKTIIYSE